MNSVFGMFQKEWFDICPWSLTIRERSKVIGGFLICLAGVKAVSWLLKLSGSSQKTAHAAESEFSGKPRRKQAAHIRQRVARSTRSKSQDRAVSITTVSPLQRMDNRQNNHLPSAPPPQAIPTAPPACDGTVGLAQSPVCYEVPLKWVKVINIKRNLVQNMNNLPQQRSWTCVLSQAENEEVSELHSLRYFFQQRGFHAELQKKTRDEWALTVKTKKGGQPSFAIPPEEPNNQAILDSAKRNDRLKVNTHMKKIRRLGNCKSHAIDSNDWTPQFRRAFQRALTKEGYSFKGVNTVQSGWCLLVSKSQNT